MERADEFEFEQFVAASGPSLLRTAWLLTSDVGHAEDLLQAVLVKVAQRWRHIDGAPEAYARRSLVNLATDRRRRLRARVHEVPLEVGADRARPFADSGFAAVELRDALARVLRRLPPRQRAVLVLRYFLDLDESEAADVLGVSVGTVKSSASRALARLRSELPASHFRSLLERAR